MIWLVTIFARWGVSQRVAKKLALLTAIIAALLLLAAGWEIWLHFHDKGVIEWYEEKIIEQVEAKSSEAAASASAAVDHSRSEVEKANDDARKAAADSDDPLRDGLNSLRGARSDKPASR